MYFRHATELWRDFPELVPGVLAVDGIHPDVSVAARQVTFHEIANARLEHSPESEFPEIQAWRRTFSRMGLKPTQYRCASEALLRRYRKEQSLPRIHPLIDICNSISLATAIPIAVFDTAQIAAWIEVRYATGSETYLAFSGEVEPPEAKEVIFSDADDQAHARRWTNRQSARSAIRDSTSSILVVAEGLHESAPRDVGRVLSMISEEINATWSATANSTLLTAEARQFDF